MTQGVAQKSVESVILPVSLPFKHEALSVTRLVPTVEILVMYIPFKPMVKPGANEHLLLSFQSVKNSLCVDSRIILANKKRQTSTRYAVTINELDYIGFCTGHPGATFSSGADIRLAPA